MPDEIVDDTYEEWRERTEQERAIASARQSRKPRRRTVARWKRYIIMLIMFVAVVAALFALTACAAWPLQNPKEVGHAVPVACIDPKDRPEKPEFVTDAEILALDTYRATWALWGDRLERQAYEKQLEAVVEGCSRFRSLRRRAAVTVDEFVHSPINVLVAFAGRIQGVVSSLRRVL